MILEINKDNFENEVLNKRGKVILDFWAPWCNPCKMMHPVFEALDLERNDITFGKVNVDENPEIAAKYVIMSIPTFLLLEDGKVIDSMVGMRSKSELDNFINKN